LQGLDQDSDAYKSTKAEIGQINKHLIDLKKCKVHKDEKDKAKHEAKCVKDFMEARMQEMLQRNSLTDHGDHHAAASSNDHHPTTSDPTTAFPTTAGPTTSDPTTSDPTTAFPTTAGPTTSDPTTTDVHLNGDGPFETGFEHDQAEPSTSTPPMKASEALQKEIDELEAKEIKTVYEEHFLKTKKLLVKKESEYEDAEEAFEGGEDDDDALMELWNELYDFRELADLEKAVVDCTDKTCEAAAKKAIKDKYEELKYANEPDAQAKADKFSDFFGRLYSKQESSLGQKAGRN
jgi:hypothetical protein